MTLMATLGQATLMDAVWPGWFVVGGAVRGVGRGGRMPVHRLTDEPRTTAVARPGLHIEVGAAARDAALSLLRIGAPVVIAGEPLPFAGARLASRSMDNRLGS